MDIRTLQSLVDKRVREIEELRNKPILVVEPLKIECGKCGKIFKTTNHNLKVQPKLCEDCRKWKCVICNRDISIGNLFCSQCYSNKRKLIDNLSSFKKGHNKQALAILGSLNPAKLLSSRIKISDGVKNSYIKNPALYRQRIEGLRRLSSNCSIDGYRSKLEKRFAEYLTTNNIKFEYEPSVILYRGKRYIPDFVIEGSVGRIAIELAGFVIENDKTFGNTLNSYVNKIEACCNNFETTIVLVEPRYLGAFSKLHEEYIGKLDVVSLEGISLQDIIHEPIIIEKMNVCDIDYYNHFLPFHSGKCKSFHSHSSMELGIVVEGYVVSKRMVVDFHLLKDILKEVTSLVDHKTIVKKDYITSEKNDSYTIEYTSDTYHKLVLPKKEVCVVDFDSTAENICDFLARRVLEKMPTNVNAVGLLFHEGLNNAVLVNVERSNYVFEGIIDIIKFHQNIKMVGE